MKVATAEDSLEPAEPAGLRRSELERLALLELQLRHVNSALTDVQRSLRLIERITIAIAVAGGGAQVLASLTGGMTP